METSGPDTKDAAKDPKNGLFYPFPSFFLPIEFIQIFNFPTSFSFFALIKISTNSWILDYPRNGTSHLSVEIIIYTLTRIDPSSRSKNPPKRFFSLFQRIIVLVAVITPIIPLELLRGNMTFESPPCSSAILAFNHVNSPFVGRRDFHLRIRHGLSRKDFCRRAFRPNPPRRGGGASLDWHAPKSNSNPIPIPYFRVKAVPRVVIDEEQGFSIQ